MFSQGEGRYRSGEAKEVAMLDCGKFQG